MKTPLVFFVVSAAAAVAVLAGVTAARWQDWPTPIETAPASSDTAATDSVTAGEAEVKDEAPEIETSDEAPADPQSPAEVAGVPDKESNAAPAQAAVPADDVAEVPTAATGESEPTEMTAAEPPLMQEQGVEPDRMAAADPQAPEAAAPRQEPLPDPEAELTTPSFDVVRLEEDGSLIVVGRAAPVAAVALLLNGEVIATGVANELGEWLLMPDQPLLPGSHQLTVEASESSGSGTMTSQVIALAVPDRAGDRPKIAVDEPAPEAEGPAVAAAPQEIAGPEPDPGTEAPAGGAEVEQVALAPAAEPQGEVDSQLQPDVAEKAALAPQPESAPEPEFEQPRPRTVPLALDSVDYNDEGDITFSGRAGPGETIRIYVDNRLVGETTADLDGRWVFAGRGDIDTGRHTLRADLIERSGKVFGRVVLPFVRAESREIAALVESRREAAGETEPEAAEVAEKAAPEPGSNVSAVVDDTRAEPKVPAVAQGAAPEPEPAASELAREIAPEPEIPAEAEGAAPQPEPAAPVLAQEAAPEPEQPALAEQPVADAPAVALADPAPQKETPPVSAAEAPPEPQAVPTGPGHVVIQPGNNLWRISRVIYGRGVEYTVIYQANRDQIRDPDLIYPGQIFATPGVHPPREIDPDWREPLNAEELARQGAAE